MKKIIYRILSLILVHILIFSLGGCSKLRSDENPVLDAAYKAADNIDARGGIVYGCEWIVLACNAWDVTTQENWRESYYKTVEDALKECSGILDTRKYSEYSGAILGITAAGYDARDAAGYDLTAKLADYDSVTLQGISGVAWALKALDVGGYEPAEFTEGTQADRDMYIDYLLSRRLESGGWAFSGERSDPDMTAMVLCALEPYTEERTDVKEAVDGAVEYLKSAQLDDGGYASFGVENAESCAQVIIALTVLGIDWDSEDFTKNGNTILDKLYTYQNKDGGFAHEVGGETDGMATEQALLALCAVMRYEAGLSCVYDLAGE